LVRCTKKARGSGLKMLDTRDKATANRRLSPQKIPRIS
jgi:hypothetical protein